LSGSLGIVCSRLKEVRVVESQRGRLNNLDHCQRTRIDASRCSPSTMLEMRYACNVSEVMYKVDKAKTGV
jgi:hypothetical protein